MHIIKHIRIEVVIMTKIAYTGGGTSRTRFSEFKFNSYFD